MAAFFLCHHVAHVAFRADHLDLLFGEVALDSRIRSDNLLLDLVFLDLFVSCHRALPVQQLLQLALLCEHLFLDNLVHAFETGSLHLRQVRLELGLLRD